MFVEPQYNLHLLSQHIYRKILKFLILKFRLGRVFIIPSIRRYTPGKEDL